MLLYLTCEPSLGSFFLSANWREHLLGHRCELKEGCWFSAASEWGDWAMCLVTYLCLLDLLSPPWSPTYLLLYATDDEWFWCPWSSSQSLLRAKSKSKAALQMISNSLLLFQSPGGLKSGFPLWDLPETAGHPYLPQIPLAHRVWHILIHVAGLLGAQPTAAAYSSLTMEAIQN